MKIMKNILFTIAMLIGAQSAMAMQLPSYWSAIKKEPATLAGVPEEIKHYLLPFVASGEPKKAAESIVSLAQVDKTFRKIINNEDTMLALINGFADVNAIITFIEQLQKHSDILPVVNRPIIITRLEDAKQSLINPEDVARAAQLRLRRIQQLKTIGVVLSIPVGACLTAYAIHKLIWNAISFGASLGNQLCMKEVWQDAMCNELNVIFDRKNLKNLSDEEIVNRLQVFLEFAMGGNMKNLEVRK